MQRSACPRPPSFRSVPSSLSPFLTIPSHHPTLLDRARLLEDLHTCFTSASHFSKATIPATVGLVPNHLHPLAFLYFILFSTKIRFLTWRCTT